MIPSTDRLGRMASAIFAMGLLYLSFIAATPSSARGISPAVSIFGLIAISARMIESVPQNLGIRLAHRLDGNHSDGPGDRLHPDEGMIGETFQMRMQQLYIEDAGRRQMDFTCTRSSRRSEDLSRANRLRRLLLAALRPGLAGSIPALTSCAFIARAWTRS